MRAVLGMLHKASHTQLEKEHFLGSIWDMILQASQVPAEREQGKS